MAQHIFREYDIRGVVARDLPPTLVTDLGRAYGAHALSHGHKRIAVGRDCRLTSPKLHQQLVAGLIEAGCHVIDLGFTPTPQLYFAVHFWELDGGIQITGSHNPPEYNGFKMMLGLDTLHGEAIQELRRRIEERDFHTPPAPGTLEPRDVNGPYVDWIASHTQLHPQRSLRIVVDGGNGAGGPAALDLYQRMGIEVIPLFIEPDGNFPNHHPDPTVAHNLTHLIDAVRTHHADFGVAFDGDGDRIGVVDERGDILWGDRLLILLARAVLAQQAGAAIVGEVKCSQTLYEDIAAHGGRPIMWKTGHSLIKAKMKAENAALAGEMSGHIFFKHRYFGFDDAIYTGARLAELVSASPQPLSQQLADVPTTHATPEIRIDCPDDLKFTIASTLAQRFAQDHEVITLDGVRVLFDDGAWALVRASNTQPVLVLRAEANTPERLEEVERWLRAEVQACTQKLSS